MAFTKITVDNFHSGLHFFITSMTQIDFTETFYNMLQSASMLFSNNNVIENAATATTSFALIAAAEIGDKSQLVCMALASRHRAIPVLLGAIAAFAFLNGLAVAFGVAIASYLPEYIIVATVAVLFAAFGLHSLRTQVENEGAEIEEKKGHTIFFTTFLLITIAEFGDKTQLAVVALSSAAVPLAVWIGATTALASTSALGIIAGRTVLQKVPLALLHKISGGIFLVLALFAAYRAYNSYTLL